MTDDGEAFSGNALLEKVLLSCLSLLAYHFLVITARLALSHWPCHTGPVTLALSHCHY